MAKKLKYLTVNDARYYESDSGNKNDTNGNPARNPNTVTHNSDRKEKKLWTLATEISNKKY